MKHFKVFAVSILFFFVLVGCSTFVSGSTVGASDGKEGFPAESVDKVSDEPSYVMPEAYVDGNVIYVVAQKLSGNTASFSYPDFMEKEQVNNVYLYLYGKHLDMFEGSTFVMDGRGYSEFTVGKDLTDDEFEEFLEQIKNDINEYLASLVAEPEPVPEPVTEPEPVIIYVEKEPEPIPEPENEKPGAFAYVVFGLIVALGIVICLYCFNMRKKEEQEEKKEEPAEQSSDKPLLN